MTACYLDASALVKLGTPEAETDALRSYLATRQHRVTSRLATVEVYRALARRGNYNVSIAERLDTGLIASLEVIELNQAIAITAACLEPTSLRSLDAIHLASALSLAPEIVAVITYDQRLADAAREAGLTVMAPA